MKVSIVDIINKREASGKYPEQTKNIKLFHKVSGIEFVIKDDAENYYEPQCYYDLLVDISELVSHKVLIRIREVVPSEDAFRLNFDINGHPDSIVMKKSASDWFDFEFVNQFNIAIERCEISTFLRAVFTESEDYADQCFELAFLDNSKYSELSKQSVKFVQQTNEQFLDEIALIDGEVTSNPTELLEMNKQILKNVWHDGFNNESELSKFHFSEGVVKMITWYDYIDPLVDGYSNVCIVKSTDELDELKINKPNLIQALYIDNGATEIDIDVGDLSMFENLELLKVRYLINIPDGFYLLTNLRIFIAIHKLNCKLDGRLANLQNLEYIDLLCTYLEFPPEISQLKKLKTLKLGSNNFNQPYAEIFKILSLESLAIHALESKYMYGISQLRNLQILVTNQVTSEIGDMNLIGLAIRQNSDESYPYELRNLKNLLAFCWQGNYTKTESPMFVSSLSKLEFIEIRGCPEFKRIPANYNDLVSLKKFDIITGMKSIRQSILHLNKIVDKIYFNEL